MFDDQILCPCLLQASVGCLIISGQNRTISGQRLNIMGQRLTISGQILMISGQEIMAGFCLIISGQTQLGGIDCNSKGYPPFQIISLFSSHERNDRDTSSGKSVGALW